MPKPTLYSAVKYFDSTLHLLMKIDVYFESLTKKDATKKPGPGDSKVAQESGGVGGSKGPADRGMGVQVR